jgi:threonine/homoserine/homoserine lactone efflux protein
MPLTFLLKGLAVGFAIAAPVGPIGVLCIRRSLADGRLPGLVTGLGAATADAAYGCVAGFGLTAVSGLLVRQKFWLGVVGGLFLCWLGGRTLLTKPAEQAAPSSRAGLLSAYLSTLFLTLTNPMTILSFVAVFAGIGLGASSNYIDASALVLGVFAGSAIWWLFLSTGVGWLQSRIGSGWTLAVNRVSGFVILTFGIYSLFSIFAKR